MDDRVILSEEYVSRGSLNLSYVREADGRVGLYLLSFIIPGWEAEPISDYQIDEESMEDLDTRGKLNLLESNSTATKLTYTLAEKEIKEKNKFFGGKRHERKNTCRGRCLRRTRP